MEACEVFELIDFLSFVIDKHLEEEGLSFFADELVHGFVDFDSVFDGVFGGLDKAHFGLIFFLVDFLFAQLVKLFDGNALLFDALLPNFHFVPLCLFLSFSIPFFLLHSENLILRGGTSASSGMANGLSSFPPDSLRFILGRRLRLAFSSMNSFTFISYIILLTH